MVLWGLWGEADRSTTIDTSIVDEGMIQIISKSVQKCMSTTTNSQIIDIDCNNKPPEMLKYCSELNTLIADTAKTNQQAANLLGEVNRGMCGCVVNNVTQDLSATVNVSCLLDSDLSTDIEASLINAFENKNQDKQDILSKFVQSVSGDDNSTKIMAPIINKSKKVIDKASVQEGIQSITNAQKLTIKGGVVSNITQRAVTQTIYATMLKNKGFSKLVTDLKGLAKSDSSSTTQPILCTVFGMGCDLSSTGQVMIFAMIAIVMVILAYLYVMMMGSDSGPKGNSRRRH